VKNFIVITTIHPKSAGITKFEQFDDWHLILVGDKKSVPVESSEGVTFLSVEDQQQLGYTFAELCPYNHYARKNIGYLYAVQQGADVIYDTDDDNLPYNAWTMPSFVGLQKIKAQRQFINIYQYFTERFIWPRGFPLDEIQQRDRYDVDNTSPLAVGVWQGLADLDPDVDAIYRLIFAEPVKFDQSPPVILPAGHYCPFNSQNTFWHSFAFPYLYLPAKVSFRFTDVLRGYIAQRLMWQQNLHLGFMSANVYQERNTHNLMRDFEQELEGYLTVKEVVALLDELNLTDDPLLNLERTYQALAEHQFVTDQELTLLRAWISDIRSIQTYTFTEQAA
jgi:hypothetical protein